MTGTRMGENWNQQCKMHSKNYGRYMWTLTPSVWVTTLPSDEPSKGVRERACRWWERGRPYPKALRAAPMMRMDTRNIWTPWNEEENQKKGVSLPPKWLWTCLSTNFSFLLSGCQANGINGNEEDIQSHNVLWQYHMRLRKKNAVFGHLLTVFALTGSTTIVIKFETVNTVLLCQCAVW